jgi:primosomal replication protein N
LYFFKAIKKMENTMPDQELICLYDMRRSATLIDDGIEETIFWSDTKGWTDEVGAQRFTQAEINAKISSGFFEENTVQLLQASALDTQRLYVVSLEENDKTNEPILFPCFAENLEHAYEQALGAYPDGEHFGVVGRHGQGEGETYGPGPA